MKKAAKIVLEGGKFYAQVGEKMHLLQPGPLGGEEALKALVGQTVQVVLSEPAPVAIIVKRVPKPCYWHCFICYRPIDIFKAWQIDPLVRAANLELYFKQGLIDEKTFKQLSEAQIEL